MVEILSRRKVDLCCVQETRYCGDHCCIIKDKLFWSETVEGDSTGYLFFPLPGMYRPCKQV